MVFKKWTRTQPPQTESTNIVNKEEEMLGRDKDTGFAPAEKDNSYPSVNSANGTIFSNDAEFKGSLSFKGNLRIDGKFEGEINSSGTMHVGPDGEVKAEVNVGNSVIEGKLTGNITAQDKIELRSSAKLFGDIKATRLIINEGVVFVGKCEVNPSGSKIEMLMPEEKELRKPIESRKPDLVAGR